MKSHTLTSREIRGLTLTQVAVSVAVVGTLLAVTFPVVSATKQKAHKQVALDKIRVLGAALNTYTSQNNGILPAEDADGNDTWSNAAAAASRDAWYNALPRLIGKKGAGDYAGNPAEFYTDENAVFLPGANYPDRKKFLQPMFAIAMNTKLQRTESNGIKPQTKMSDIARPDRTVAFLEQGLLNEDRTLTVQTRNDYDGSPKGSPKSFVGRYDGQGVLCFIDGHAEFANATDVLDPVTASIPFPQNQYIWTPKPEENPNKDAEAQAREKKKK